MGKPARAKGAGSRAVMLQAAPVGAATGPVPEPIDELARERRNSERLRFLVETSKLLHATLDLFELFRLILKITSEQTAAERATIFLLDAPRHELWSLIAQGLEQKEIRLPMGEGLAGWVAEHGETVNLPDAYGDLRFDARFDASFGYRTRSLLAMPVKDRDGRIVAVLELLNSKNPRFTEADIEFVLGISVHAAIALENARLHRDAQERQRLDRDLAVARTIQRALLPEAPPQRPEFDIAVRHEASYYVGGDYYDFLSPNEGVEAFVIADVEGKGAASALVMSNVQASLRTLIEHVHSLEGVLFHLNETLRRWTRGQRYLTLFLGLIDVARRRLHYINAGHLPPVVLGVHGATALSEGGMALGLFPSVRYKRGVHQLEAGDVIVACTDGIVESESRDEEQYGQERVVSVAESQRAAGARAIVDAIFTDVLRHSEGGAQRDDRIALAIKVL